MLNTDEIEKRLDRTTQGEWYRWEYYENPTADHLASYEEMLRVGHMDGPDRDWPAVDHVQATIPTRDRLDIETVTICIAGNGPTSRFNAEFIAHAPEDIRALLDLRTKLQLEIDRLHDERERLGEQTVRNVLNSLLWLVDSHPHEGRAGAIRDTAHQLGETLAAYFRGELADPPDDDSPF